MSAQPDHEYLPGALQALDDAIHSLVAPQSRTHKSDTASSIITKPGIYTEMLESIEGQQGTSTGGIARSMPPVWVDGLDWISRVDSTVKEWWPEQGSTIDRLDRLSRANWRPQDAPLVSDMANSISRWAKEAESLLDGMRDKFSVVAPCPACGESFVYRTDGLGENVKVPALEVSNMGCNCQACKYHWGLDYFHHLAAVLECKPIEGVIVDAQPE